jgi:hypothetical protein
MMNTYALPVLLFLTAAAVGMPLLWDSETNVVETSVITAGKLEMEDDEVVLILLVVGVEDRVLEDVLEAALEVPEELILESEEEEEALVEDEDEEGKDVVGVVDGVVSGIGNGRIGDTAIIDDEDDANVGLD